MLNAGKSITLKAVQKSWGETTSLRGIDLHIPAGKFTTVLGPSGCGKSTTLRIVAGLEEVSAGAVYIGDEEVTAKPPAARDIAMVFQSYALFPHLSVAENIIFGLKVRGMNRSDRTDKLKSAADLLGLSALLDRKPSQLSGGQQQRVALGRAIVADKSIFLMDEPLSNLDAKLRAEMREEIRELQQRLGVTMLYVTHDQVEAVTMADQVVLMNQGRVEQVASPREIYAQPNTLFTAKFIGTPPMSTCAPSIFGDEYAEHVFQNHGALTFGIRPEALRISDQGPLRGTVKRIEYLGADMMIECMIHDQVILCRAPGKAVLKIGDPICLALDPADLHVFDANSGQRLAHLPSEIGSPVAA